MRNSPFVMAGLVPAIHVVDTKKKTWMPGTRRREMFQLRRACEDGDTRACVQFGIIIGENRERRAQWRRESPELFWWER
jgi:hypothetical protein